VVWHRSQIWRTQRNKRFRCSSYKKTLLITGNKPVAANTWSPVTIKNGKVCGKLALAMKQRKCISVTCSLRKLNWVYIIYTTSNTDNPNRCNEFAHSCMYSVEYWWQKVMTSKETQFYNMSGLNPLSGYITIHFHTALHRKWQSRKQNTQKTHSSLINQANWPQCNALIHQTTKQSLKMKNGI
jgi:hypothetical protein